MYLSHGVRLCVPLHTHKRVKRAFHSLEHPTARVWSLEASPYSLLCGTASFPCPHLKRVSKIYSQLGSNMHVHFATTGCGTTRRKNTHTPLALHTYCSEAPGMETRSTNTSPRKHAEELARLLYAPCKCTELSGGGN